jgi:putative PIN family toxin of toxin-antitoxin system
VKVILDTNVVLDWLLFDHISVHPLRDRIRDGRLVVFTYPGAATELRRVLGYRQFELDEVRQAEIIQRYHSQTQPVPDEVRVLIERMEVPKGFPHCRDPDDNHFLALAWHAKADALVSKDKRVLKCRRKTLAFGFTILNVPQAIAAIEQREASDGPSGLSESNSLQR